MAHTVLELAAGAMRSDLPIRPLLARDVPHGKAIVLAEIASVQATIHAGTTEHLLVTDSTDLERRQWHRPSGTVHRLAELGRTGQAVYPGAVGEGYGSTGLSSNTISRSINLRRVHWKHCFLL